MPGFSEKLKGWLFRDALAGRYRIWRRWLAEGRRMDPELERALAERIARELAERFSVGPMSYKKGSHSDS